MEVNVMQNIESRTTSSDSYFCLRMNLSSPIDLSASHRTTYENASRVPENISSRPLKAFSFGSLHSTKYLIWDKNNSDPNFCLRLDFLLRTEYRMEMLIVNQKTFRVFHCCTILTSP